MTSDPTANTLTSPGATFVDEGTTALKGDELKMVMDGLKQLPELPKLDWGSVSRAERPKRYLEWRVHLGLAFEGVSAEVSKFWEATLIEVDKTHELYLRSGAQEKAMIRPMITYPKRWELIEHRLRVLVVGLLPNQLREKSLERRSWGRRLLS